jgi:hypothetical protein
MTQKSRSHFGFIDHLDDPPLVEALSATIYQEHNSPKIEKSITLIFESK